MPHGRTRRALGRAIHLVALAVVSMAGEEKASGAEANAFVPVAELLGSSDPSGQPNVMFGRSVSISGDTLIVGAPEEDTTSAVNAGAAYVYVRSGAGWMLQARLRASDADYYYEFGYSVSVWGDTALIAAPDPTGNDGRVYVFVRSGTTWTEQQRLMPSDPAAYPFGGSVSVSGDTAVIGAVERVGGGGGAAFVFARSGATWTEQAKLVNPSGEGGDRFGSSVAVASADAILVGASGENGASGANSGAVHVFARDGTSWTAQAKLTASDGTASQEFGYSMAVSADTLVVGAPSSANALSSAAYVFVRSGATWTEEQKLVSQDAAAYRSGVSVSVSGDTAVVGGSLSGAIVGGTGTIYVFVRSGTTWTEQPKLTASDGAPFDDFGTSVSIHGDTVVAGAPRVSTRAGAVYVFGRSGATWAEQTKLPSPVADATGADHFGSSVSVSGDTVAIGAPDDDVPTATYGGSAYVFTRSGAGWSRQKLVASNVGPNDHFGTSVAVSGDTLVVGAPDVGGPAGTHGYGYAYAFVRHGTSWSEQQILGSSWTELFGVSVSVSGDTAVVGGTPRPPYYDTGAAAVFVRSGATWTQQQRLLSPLGAPYDNFGSSVAVYGDTLAVTDTYTLNSATYVFLRSGGSWTLQQTLNVSGPVSISEDTLVVGRRVFVRSGAAWTLQQVLTTSDGMTGASSVQVSGTRLVLGGAGAAYVFERLGTAWVERQKLLPPAPQPYGAFGAAVALSGGTVVVGDPNRDTAGGPDAGAAFVFEERGLTADLWVRKTDGHAAAMPGENLTYAITVGNAGPDAVEGAVVTDVLPAALVCTTTCTGTGGATCRTGPFDGSIADAVRIPAGQSVTYTSACTVSGSATGSLSNTATVTPPATVSDPYPGNNSATDTDTLDPAADLELGLTQSADNAIPGGVLDYVITVTNRGPWPSTGMTVTDVLPSDTTLAAWGAQGACSLVGDTVECELVPLPAGETHTVTVQVVVDAGARGVLHDVATVEGNEPDPVAANNSDRKTALVSAPTQLFTIVPCRVVDTRDGSAAPVGGPALAARQTRVFALAGHCGIPASARAVALNVTVIGAEAGGNLRLFPAGLSVPLSVVVSYGEGQTRGNNGVVALNAEGEIAAYVGQPARTKVHVIVDVAGYFE